MWQPYKFWNVSIKSKQNFGKTGNKVTGYTSYQADFF
ncbi:MAG: hypothetical protein JWR05_3620 [Mucilaginibacter sp.]|nr:hypothetical protein [Mucilaginibacter sp.]